MDQTHNYGTIFNFNMMNQIPINPLLCNNQTIINNMNNMNNFDPIQMNYMMNLMNQNINMKNQIDMSNFILNMMMMNQSKFNNNFNNIYQQQNYNLNGINEINFQNNNLNNEANLQNSVFGRIKENNKEYNDPFPGYKGRRINCTFLTQEGTRINIAAPENIKVKELFLKFINRVGLDEKVLGNKIFFIIDGRKINEYDDRTIKNFLIDNEKPLTSVPIVVLETKGLC